MVMVARNRIMVDMVSIATALQSLRYVVLRTNVDPHPMLTYEMSAEDKARTAALPQLRRNMAILAGVGWRLFAFAWIAFSCALHYNGIL